jgi:cytochrome c biogenesis protein CcmG/thiol:disulfide interchange protein DsbE
VTDPLEPVERPRRRTARNAAIAAGVIVALLAVVLALATKRNPDPQVNAFGLGEPAPAFTLPLLDGGRVSLADLRGRVVFVNFWNDWCIPCRQEHPALSQFYGAHKDDPDFAFVGVVRDSTPRAVRSWIASNPTPWTIALDPDHRAALDFGTRGQPETYVVNARGVLVAKYLAPASVATLETMLSNARRSAR